MLQSVRPSSGRPELSPIYFSNFGPNLIRPENGSTYNSDVTSGVAHLSARATQS